MIFRPNARARDRIGVMSEATPYQSPIQGYEDFANRDKTVPPSSSSQMQHWQDMKVVSTDNSGSPFTSAKCTDGFIPSMLAAKNYVELSVAEKRQGASVGLSEADSATISIVSDVKTYIADFSAGSEAVAIIFDFTGVSGAFEFDLWVTPAEGKAFTFPAGILWFDSMGPESQMMRDSDKRYLFHFDSLDGETLYGRFTGSVYKEA